MNKAKKILKTALLLLPYILLALWLILPDAFTIFRGTRLETTTDMQNQIKITTQEKYDFFPDSASMQAPPAFSVPLHKTRYRHEPTEYSKAEDLKNPLPINNYTLARGKNRFGIFCVICHGEDGKGNGRITTQPKLADDEEGFPPPADLCSEHTRNLSDGRLFHILSAGQNLMFPVNFKMNATDRWAVVLYIRNLQKKSK